MKRGLLRLWVLVSTCWVLAVGTIGVSRVVEEMCIIGPAGAPCSVFERYADSSGNADVRNIGINLPGRYHLIFHNATVLFWLSLTFLPVLGLFVFGRAVLW